MSREQERITLGQIMAAILLMMAGTVLFFYHLGKTGLDRETPARIAVYAGQMNANNLWVAPVLRGTPHVDVPPLYLWAARLFSGFATTLTAYQERIPGALSAGALVLLAAWWLWRHATRYNREDMAEASPEGFALLGGLILATNPVLFTAGRAGSLHTMFVLFYIGAALCWSESLEARRSFYAGRPWRNWVLWGYALAGVAMLVRGPLVLPLLWVPYWLAARSYHLRRIDWVHAAGLGIALAIGASWPVSVSLVHPAAAGGLWREWLSMHVGTLDASDTPSYEYLYHIFISSFPWNVLALVMAVRVWRRIDRSPTLVFWMSSLVGNLLVLTFLSTWFGQHRLPVVVFISLLAADAIYRWNFESAWAVAWRVLLRVLIAGGIAASIFGALLLKSNLGVLLFILLALAWAGWALRSRAIGVVYTPWETTVRLGAMMVCLLLAGETVLLGEYEPKREFYESRLAYFNRIIDRVENSEAAMVFQEGPERSILYDFYLGLQPLLTQPAAALRAPAERDLYLFAEEVKRIVREPNLETQTLLWNGEHTQPREGMFRVLTRLVNGTTVTTASQPWRVGLLGNQGTSTKDQRMVGRRLNSFAGHQPIDDVLLLGNNIQGQGALNKLDIVDSFEDPYRQLLKRGITFHAALGREDQGGAWLQVRYPPFNMENRRYYTFTTGPMLIDVFMLDGERLHAGGRFDEAQLAWLANELAVSRAPWKVVGLSQALGSSSPGARVDAALAARMLPLLAKYKVDIVAWPGGVWYERLELTGPRPVFLNAGWSGNNRKVTFLTDPRAKVAYAERPGFVVLEFTERDVAINAITDKGKVVDRYILGARAPLGTRTASSATTSTAAATPPPKMNFKI